VILFYMYFQITNNTKMIKNDVGPKFGVRLKFLHSQCEYKYVLGDKCLMICF